MLAETSSLRLWLAACRQAEPRPPIVSMRCRVVAASLWPCPRLSRWVVDFLAILPAFVEPTSSPVPPAACRQTEPRPPTVSMRCHIVAARLWTCLRFARWAFVFLAIFPAFVKPTFCQYYWLRTDKLDHDLLPSPRHVVVAASS